MNKATKGALAAAAAAAILAGGAGTMAAWTSSANGTGGGTVTAGSMNVTQQGTGVWTWADGAPIADIAAVRLVPGDSVKYTATYNVTLVGQNLNAQLTPTLGGVTGELKNFLDVSPSAGASIAAVNGPQEVSTTITFKSDTQGEDGQGKSATLAGATVTLTQVP